MEHLLRPGQRAPIRVPNYQQRPDVDGKIATVDDCARLFGAVIKQATSPTATPYEEVEALWVEYCHRGRVYSLCHGLLDQFYFGLLYQIVGPDIIIADFTVRDESGSVFLSTANLNQYLLAWKARVTALDEGQAAELSTRVVTLLHQACFVLRHLATFLTRSYETVPVRQAYPRDEEPLGNTHFACMLLYHSLHDAWRATLPTDPKVDTSELWSCRKSPWLQKRLEREGWCPYTIGKLAPAARLMAYGYMLGTMRTVTADHGKCSQVACIQNNISAVNDLTESQIRSDRSLRHVTAKCECWTIEAPVAEITEMLQRGEIPVLRIATDDGYKLSLHCRKAEPDRKDGRYIALSHLTRIARHLGRLEATEGCGELAIWLDTLCIPAASDDPHMRELGIAKMHQVYKEAYAVIMMDADLTWLEQRPSAEELAIRVYMSAWSSRLWTFQEGALNDRLLVMTADGLVDVDQCVQDTVTNGLTAVEPRHELNRMALGVFSTIRDRPYSNPPVGSHEVAVMRKDTKIFGARAQWLFYSIERRTSSRQDDEATIIATYLDLPVPSTTLLSSEERMVALIKSMPFVIPDILFAGGPRIQTPGFRWAPSTFVKATGGDIPYLYNFTAIDQETRPTKLTRQIQPSYLDSESRGLWTFNPALQVPKVLIYDPNQAIMEFDMSGRKAHVRPKWPRRGIREAFTTLVEQTRKEKKELLILFPGTLPTYKQDLGVLAEIVGDVDSTEYGSAVRLRRVMTVQIDDVGAIPVIDADGTQQSIASETGDRDVEWFESRYWLVD